MDELRLEIHKFNHFVVNLLYLRWLIIDVGKAIFVVVVNTSDIVIILVYVNGGVNTDTY